VITPIIKERVTKNESSVFGACGKTLFKNPEKSFGSRR